MHHCRSQQGYSKHFAAGNGPAFIVESPAPVNRLAAFLYIALYRLWSLIEDLAVFQRTHELDVLGVRPDQGTSGSRGLAEEKFALRNIGIVPDLLRLQSAPVGRAFHRLKQLLRAADVTRRKLIVGALTGKQRPRTPDSGSVKGSAVGMLSVAIIVVAIPARPLRKPDLQKRVNNFDGVQDFRIIWRTQAKSHQCKCVRADDVRCTFNIFSRRTIFNGNETFIWRGRTFDLWRRNSHVISIHANLPCQIAALRIGPPLDAFIPGIGEIADVGSCYRFTHCIGDVGRRQQSRDFYRQSERGIAGVLFPSVLLRDWAIAGNETHCPPHHWPPALHITKSVRSFPAQQIDEQDRKCSLIHLQPVPVRGAVQPHVLWPAPIGLLCRFEIVQNSNRVPGGSGSQEAGSSLNQISRPDEVIPAQIVVTFVEAPGNGKAGDYAAKEILRLVHAEHRRACAIDVLLDRPVERQKSFLPPPPLGNVILENFVVVIEKGCPHKLAGFGPVAAEPQCQYEFSIRGGKIYFPG